MVRVSVCAKIKLNIKKVLKQFISCYLKVVFFITSANVNTSHYFCLLFASIDLEYWDYIQVNNTPCYQPSRTCICSVELHSREMKSVSVWREQHKTYWQPRERAAANIDVLLMSGTQKQSCRHECVVWRRNRKRKRWTKDLFLVPLTLKINK